MVTEKNRVTEDKKVTNRRVTRVGWISEKLTLKLEQDFAAQENGDRVADIPTMKSTFTGKEWPDKKLLHDLEKLKSAALNIMEFGDEWPGIDELEVTAVGIGYGTNEYGDKLMIGCQLVCQTKLHERVWPFKTPYLKFNQVGDEKVFPDADNVRHLVRHALDYLDGKRAQADLFEPDDNDAVAIEADKPLMIEHQPDEAAEESEASEEDTDNYPRVSDMRKSLESEAEKGITVTNKADQSIYVGDILVDPTDTSDEKHTHYLVFQIYKNGKAKIRPVTLDFGVDAYADIGSDDDPKITIGNMSSVKIDNYIAIGDLNDGYVMAVDDATGLPVQQDAEVVS